MAFMLNLLCSGHQKRPSRPSLKTKEAFCDTTLLDILSSLNLHYS